MNLLSLFSGIGAFEKALDNEGIKYNLVNYCEIDKYASRSYAAIHNVSEELNLIDVTKIDTSSLSDIDLITYGFPCQDISQAGNQKGFTDKNGERTRSGLFFEALRIIKDLQPKYAIAENVKALTSKKFKAEFETVLSSLNDAGYNNYYDVLNAKNYGVPQNRERVFIVSIRKDVDDGSFCFPAPQPLNIRLKDILEENVDEKFYLSQEQINSIKNSSYLQNKRRVQQKEWCDTLCARDWKDPKCVEVEEAKIEHIGNIYGKKKGTSFAGNVYNPKGLCPTITTMGGGNRQPLIMKEPKIIEPIIMRDPPLEREGWHRNAKEVLNTAGICRTLSTQSNNLATKITDPTNCRIRKLTPKECWRLMGFSDEDFEKAKAAGISNSQLYKQAGNSIVVTVLQGILKNLF